MTTMHQAQSGVCHPKFIQRVAPECRVIVDDVDAERLLTGRDTEPSPKPKTEVECDNTSSLENPIARIKQIQVEAESRKIEFARLLEEHAQVIRRLKQMEESESSHHIPTTVASVTKA